MNRITGRVVQAESGIGIPNLLVVILDLDPNTAPEEVLSTTTQNQLKNSPERLGSVLTDKQGLFTFSYDDGEFRLQNPKEKRPDILLTILAPEDAGTGKEPKVLYQAAKPRQNAGRSEAYFITIPGEKLKDVHLAYSTESAPPDLEQEVEEEVNKYIARTRKERKIQTAIARIEGEAIRQSREKQKQSRKKILTSLGKKLEIPGGKSVQEGESIEDKQNEVVVETIQRVSESVGTGTSGIPVNLYLSPADKRRLEHFFAPDQLVDGMAVIPESELKSTLFNTNGSENPGTLLFKDSPFSDFCKQQSTSEKCATTNTGIATPDNSGNEINAADGPIDSPVLEASDIPSYVGKLLDSMETPEEALFSDGEKRADKSDIAASVADFSLNKGPADMTAFYDFNYLNVAFEHVWKQLFDEDIIQAAHRAESLGSGRFGMTIDYDMPDTLAPPGYVSPEGPMPVPDNVAKHFDITEEEYNLLRSSYMVQLILIADDLNKMIKDPAKSYQAQRLREQGEQIIDRVRLDDYGNLHKTLRDLKQRLSGTYEFTVYAADKDFHYVNFGLLNTYRQQWTPLNYQTGRLVKTIALSPKEEQTYSVKQTRNEKLAVKEARKNSSTQTSEQSSTAKVETEIIKKAQSKTNFSLATEGTYDVLISEGKASTNFGIEAQNESSENRKDMRESVLKAAQEFKDEYSIDIDTEQNTTSEYNESGKIVNPNDELTVTYLFYELQRRFRLSEKLYRVMPVVMVAQEVPSPDQITEAWVVMHDWILNRYLLDDSFRQTLQYLSNKSVGDDFAVRELRKNLRQQRSLVETLRIEMATASAEAANRYQGLENAVKARIGIEEAESTEGWFESVGEFFGGSDDLSPEAAKARELAAQDAHRFAVERAEKIVAALRQELGILNGLTADFNKAMQTHLDNEARIKRLLVHIRNNILYYMQAIWRMEPPDQRYLRLYNVKVATLEFGTTTHPIDSSVTSAKFYYVDPEVSEDIFRDFRDKEYDEEGNVTAYTEKHKAFMHASLRPHSDMAESERFKPLVQVADLDQLLGFKGNYMIFPLKEHNALTACMAAPYVDAAFGAMDPEELSNVSLDEYSNYVCCLHKNLSAEAFEAIKPQLRYWLEKLLATPLRNGDEITVPTSSLFIEALPGSHTLLEDFKLRHRKLDVSKVRAEVRKMELENIRYAARLLNEEREDPDVEKRIVVEGVNPIINPEV